MDLLNTLLNNNMLQLSYLIVILYSISIVLLLYSLAHFNLLLNYLKSKKTKDQSSQYNLENPSEIPFVTIQLPIYNENMLLNDC
jgi:cellulose synthase/poly-beta-1,6-N-acetylglucosamine synthase-like glycosyltransferase